MPVVKVDEFKKCLFLVQKLSIHEQHELLKHVVSLMRWFNSNISYRSFIFLLKNNILKSPSNKMKSHNMYVIFEFQRDKLAHFEKEA